MEEARRRLGETLVEAGVLTQEALDRALAIQQKQQLRLGTILLHEGFVTESQLVQGLSLKLSIPWVSLWRIDIPDEVLELVPANVAEEFFLMPIYIRTSKTGERALYVAMNDPMDEDALRFVAANAGMPVKPMIAGPSDIAAAIRAYYYGEDEAGEEDESGRPVATVSSSRPSEGAEPSSPPPPPAAPGAPPPPPPARATPAGKAPAPPPNPEPELEDTDIELSGSELEAMPKEPAPPLAEVPPPPPPEAAPPVPVVAAEKPAESAPAVGASAVEAPAAQQQPVPDGEGKVYADKTAAQRDAEKLLFGVGGAKPTRGLSLTLLDGTTISFGPKKKKGKAASAALSQDDLLAGLKSAAMGDPMDDFLPAAHWESYMAALLKVLFNKHLVLYPEFMKELETIEKKK